MDALARQFYHDMYERAPGIVHYKQIGRGAVHILHCPTADALEQAVEYCTGRDTNGYFGVVTSTGCVPMKELAAPAVWVDIDAKEASKSDILQRLLSYRLRPSYIIDSGHGHHAYWILYDPCYDLDLVESINRYLIEELGGDKQCWNRGRIMRAPGSINWKDVDRPVPCLVAYASKDRYCSAQFGTRQATFAKVVTDDEIDFSAVPYTVSLDDFGLHLMWVKLITAGYSAAPAGRYVHPSGGIDRSACDFAVALALHAAGIHKLSIASIFLNPQYGISEKTLSIKDTKARQRYVSRTVCRAAALVKGRQHDSQDCRHSQGVCRDAEGAEE